MTARERVVAALSHKKADRLPRYEIFLSDYVDQWRRTRGLSDDVDIYDYYPKVDIGRILATHEGPFTSRVATQDLGDGTYLSRDSWGRLQKCSTSGTFFEVLEVALPDKSMLDSLVFEDSWPTEQRDAIVTLEHQIGDRFAPVSGVMGLFMPSYYLRGEFELLIDLKEDEAFCRALVERVAEFITDAGEKALRYTNTWDTAIWVYDEFGNNKSSIISPDVFERVYLQPYKKMISRWKSLGARNVILHCDGNCIPLLDLLLEAGFTGLQGVNPTTGMTVPEVKAKYGNRLAIIGGMCNIQVLNKGTKAEIEANVASVVEAGRDGGVIIGTHSVDLDLPQENYDYYCSVLDQFDEQW